MPIIGLARRARRRLPGAVVGALATAMAVVTLSPVGAAAAGSSVIAHDVTGCGKPTTVFEPASPGGTLSAQALGLSIETPLLRQANQHHVRWLSTLTCKPRPDRTRQVPFQGTGSTSTNWSGYENDGSNNSHAYAQAYWTVPSITPPDKSPGDFSVIWPGIGQGFGGGALIQDGTGQDAICLTQPPLCGTYTLNYYFWLEIYPDEYMQQVTNLTPSPGDSVATSVEWLSPNANFLLCDYNQNTCVYASQRPAHSPENSSEWIVEREAICTPTCNLYGLADFGSVGFTNALYNYNPSSPINAGNFHSITMRSNDNSQVLAVPTDLGSDGASFLDYWQNYGP